MRHPSVIMEKFDEIQALPLNDRYLSIWKTRLVEIVFEFTDLTEDLVDSILSQSDIAPIEERCYQKDLAFSFYRKSSRAEEATRDLARVIDLVHEEHEGRIIAGLALEAFKRNVTAEAFAEQKRAVEDADAFKERLSRWIEEAHDADTEARRA